MCGILGAFNIQMDYAKARAFAIQLSRIQRHRGPDDMGIIIHQQKSGSYNIICHERLSILDLSEEGKQPFDYLEKQFTIAVNGEIFNYQQIKQKYKNMQSLLKSYSDCEGLSLLYQNYRTNENYKEMFNEIEGMFACIIYDNRKEQFIVGRDHLGIIPLYIGITYDQGILISSELKCINEYCFYMGTLYPGNYIVNNLDQVKWFFPKYQQLNYIPQNLVDYKQLRQNLIKSIKKQLQSDVPFGLLISGGLDSSIIASIVMKLIKSGEVDIKQKGMQQVYSFCIGIPGSHDLEYSRKVAEHIGTEHVEFHFTPQQGLDVYPEVIYHCETFNPTTIRASIPMYLMARRIKQYGIKTCFSGEGADELFGGYLYFHKAPNANEFQQELVRKVNQLHKYDLLRANKSTMAWGVEIRPPFLDKNFIQYAMDIDPIYKMPKLNEKGIEKYILRKAFENDYLPASILWRQKEQFSDGVGYDWIDQLKIFSQQQITDTLYQLKHKIFPLNPPLSKEMMLYRKCFEQFFKGENAVRTVGYEKSIACSTSFALEWDQQFKNDCDESGRAIQDIHKAFSLKN